jgi:hypothetical protein
VHISDSLFYLPQKITKKTKPLFCVHCATIRYFPDKIFAHEFARILPLRCRPAFGRPASLHVVSSHESEFVLIRVIASLFVRCCRSAPASAFGGRGQFPFRVFGVFRG